MRRSAFTLLEVIVGLFLLGSLVASGLVALASHQSSILLARQKQEACRVAETLLTNWYEQLGDIPTRSEGLIAPNGEWGWRTEPIGFRSVCGLPTSIIRLQIFRTGERIGQYKMLTSVELLQSQNASQVP